MFQRKQKQFNYGDTHSVGIFVENYYCEIPKQIPPSNQGCLVFQCLVPEVSEK